MPTCPRPYELIGTQCLFFSQPYLPWGLSESWAEAYLNYYDAVVLCRQQAANKGLKGKVDEKTRLNQKFDSVHCSNLTRYALMNFNISIGLIKL